MMTQINRILFLAFIFILISFGLKAQQPIGTDVIIYINVNLSTDSLIRKATISIFKTKDTTKIIASKIGILGKSMLNNVHTSSIVFQGVMYRRELNTDSSINRYVNYDNQTVYLKPSANSDEEKLYYPVLTKLIDSICRLKQETLEQPDSNHILPFAEKLQIQYEIITSSEIKKVNFNYPASAARSPLLNLLMFAGAAIESKKFIKN
jgi:hypothetical protein